MIHAPKPPLLPELSKREQQTLRIIRNRLQLGQTTSIRELANDLGYRSPRSAAILIEDLIRKGHLRRTGRRALALVQNPAQDTGATVAAPLVEDDQDLTLLAEQLDECRLSIAVAIRLAAPPGRYFLIKAPDAALAPTGLGMGDLALIRLSRAAQAGDVVACSVDGKPVIRVWQPTRGAVVLKASEPGYPPIILHADAQPLGVLVAVLPAEVLAA